MVDGNEERRDRSGGPDAERGAGELDRTRAFDPLAEQEPGAARQPGRAGPDETVRQPAADQTAPYQLPGGPGVPPDPTAPLPSGPAGNRPQEPAAWSGRAAVPPPIATEVRETGPVGWAGAEERPSGRPWWLPILAGIVALLLLTVLAYGLWLISQSRDGEAPVGPTSSPPVPTSAAPAATSAPPTTEAPSPTERATTPGTVLMPPVIGLRQEEATALLDQLGLSYRVRFRQSDRPSGTVVRSDPEAGTPVSPDTRITLIVAEGPPHPETTAPAPATSNPGPTPSG